MHARFSDHAGLAKCSRWRSWTYCLPLHGQCRHPESVFYRGSMAGLHVPCRRFADILADACARLGADVGRYSFIAVDLHHLLLAGLPAHLCENTQEPTSRRIVSSIALFPIAATALFVFRLTKSRRIFCAKIERLCFHTASVDSGPSPDLLGRQGSTVSGRGCEPCRQTLRRARPPHPVRGCPSPIIKSGQEPLCETDQL